VLPPRLYPGSWRAGTIRPLARRRREAPTLRVAPPRVSGWSCNEEQAGQAFYVARSQITAKSARRTKKTLSRVSFKPVRRPGSPVRAARVR